MDRSKLVSPHQIKTLLIGCSADVSHTHHVGELADVQFDDFSNQRGKDFLEIAVPGSFPPPDSFDAIESLILRYAIEKIVILTHSDCGAILAINERLQDPPGTPELFTNAAEIVCNSFEALDISTENELGSRLSDLAYAQAKVLTHYVAQQIDEKRQQRLEAIGSAANTEEQELFCEQLADVEIGAFVSLPPATMPLKVVDYQNSRAILDSFETPAVNTPFVAGTYKQLNATQGLGLA